MGLAGFNFVNTKLAVQFALTNAVITKNPSSNSQSLINFTDGSYPTSPNVTVYIDNITVKNNAKGQNNLRTILCAAGASTRLSGINYFENIGSFNSEILSLIEFADGASVTIKSSSDSESAAFVGAYSTRYSTSTISMGDRSSVTLYEDSDASQTQTSIWGFASLKAGKEVTWNQHGWGSFIDS